MTDSHIGAQHQLSSDSPAHRSLGFRLMMSLLILAAFAIVFFVVITHRAAPQRSRAAGDGELR